VTILLVILLVKVNKKLVSLHTRGGGGGVGEMTQNVTYGEGGLKIIEKCHVLFEWPLKM
jgi:hypothetical protein